MSPDRSQGGKILQPLFLDHARPETAAGQLRHSHQTSIEIVCRARTRIYHYLLYRWFFFWPDSMELFCRHQGLCDTGYVIFTHV